MHIIVDATNFVKTVEQHQHRKIACLEEIAYLNGWIDEAVKFFNEAIIKEPDNKEFLYALAYLYYRNGDYEKTRGTVFKIFKTI